MYAMKWPLETQQQVNFRRQSVGITKKMKWNKGFNGQWSRDFDVKPYSVFRFVTILWELPSTYCYFEWAKNKIPWYQSFGL